MPKWNELFKEVLIYYSDGQPHINRKAKIEIADSLNLSEELRNEITDKHRENKIEGRIGWTLSGLKIAGLLKQHEYGSFIITDEGINLFQNLPDILDENYLINNYEKYKLNKEKNKKRRIERLTNQISNEDDTNLTPEENIEKAVLELNNVLGNELLDQLYQVEPRKFEYIVSDLLDKMGYGDLRVTQQSNDGGIDAIVDEDKLGLDKILVQAKRYAETNIIRSTQIRDFLGALASQKVQKGIFVTTSDFHQSSIDLAKGSDKKLVLINGEELAKLMIEYNVGTSITKNISIKSIDTDYFN